MDVQQQGEVVEQSEITRRGPAFGWYIAGFGILLAVLIYGMAIYPDIPARFATHWGGNGKPNGYMDKSLGSVFFVVFFGAGMLALLLATGWGISRAPLKSRYGFTPEQAHRQGVAQLKASQLLLGIIACSLSAAFAVAAVMTWSSGVGSTSYIPGYLPLIAFFLPSILGGWYCWRSYRRDVAGPAQGGDGPTGGHTGAERQTHPQHPDDDSLWMAGLIYNNPDDPSLLVPKRAGIGWTINWGRPAGKAITLAMLLLILAGVVTAVVVASTSG